MEELVIKSRVFVPGVGIDEDPVVCTLKHTSLPNLRTYK